MAIQLKRVYEKAGRHDGTRVLIDRVWPRGVKKADAGIDLWLKEIAPSTRLRQWFGHDPQKWPDFKQRLKNESGRIRYARLWRQGRKAQQCRGP